MLLRLRGWIRALARRRVVEREMQEEMQLHIERATERLIARGLAPEEALARAKREFGNVAYVQEQARDARGVRWIEDALQDLRYAMRGLRRKPGFAIAVVLTLSLGVGANATMFGIIDRLLFRPPAFLIAPDRAHHLYFTRFLNGAETVGQSFPYRRFLDLAGSSKTMEVIAAYAPRQLSVGSGDNAREITVGAASASLWQLFDVRPAVGRFFTALEDSGPNAARVAVLSYSYWQSQYAGSPSVLGTEIVITPSRYTIIGVAPAGFAGVERETPGVFIPLSAGAADDFGPRWATESTEYSTSWLGLYGRRKAGITAETATADLSAAFRESYRKQLALEPRYTAPIESAKPRMFLSSMLAERGPRPSADARVATWLFGVTVIVLAIACANVGNLLLARSLTRRREIAVRLALGVSRGRLVRHILLESICLAALGGIAGLVVAQYGGRLLWAFLMPDLEWRGAFGDRRTLLFASLATLTVGVCAGIVPVVQASRYEVASTLKAGGRDGHGQRSRLRSWLILTQVALSVVLLAGAGLFARSVRAVARLDIGYDVDRLVVVDLRMRTTILDSAGHVALRRALTARAEQHPAVESVTPACSVPFAGTCAQRVFVAGIDSTNRLGEFVRQHASPSYFRTTGTRVLRGRPITSEDRAGSPLVAVVSEAMARVLWPGQDALGKCFRTGSETAPCRTVVGVAENVKQEQIGDDTGFEYYVPAAQDGEGRGRLLVRVRSDPAVQAEALRRDLTRLMPQSAYLTVRPMAKIVSNVTRSWRLGAVMFSAFGLLALIVAAVGLYSVVAYDVTQRKHEMGLRIALGAHAADIVGLVVRGGMRMVAAGSVVGIGITLLASHWLEPLLFQVSPRDPLVFSAVAFVLVGVALVASALPAVHASRVDPANSLRSD